MSEHCCGGHHHEAAVEVDYAHPHAKMAKSPMVGNPHSIQPLAAKQYVPASKEEVKGYYKNKATDETSHPAFPHKQGDISKCPVMGAGMKSIKEGVDWHAKYLEAQRELIDEAGRWSKRVKDLEVAYAEKIMRIEQNYTATMEQGFEEAYKLIMSEREKFQQEKEEMEKIAEQGYAEAWNIIQDLRKNGTSAATEMLDKLADSSMNPKQAILNAFQEADIKRGEAENFS